MTHDIYLVIGILLVGISIPSMFGALADRRSPRVAAIVIMIGGSLILLALSQKPGGYTFDDIPRAFIRVIAYYFR